MNADYSKYKNPKIKNIIGRRWTPINADNDFKIQKSQDQKHHWPPMDADKRR